MDELNFDELKLFVRVAALGTLSAVARERNVPVSQVSRSLARIEKACGARLIHRSTHGLALTAEGETFLGYCQRLTGTLEELEGEFAIKSRGVSGLVRVAASTVMAQYQIPNNRGDNVYGGSNLTVVRGGFDQLLALNLEPQVRTAAEQSLRYHEGALKYFPGMFASRSNYDVAQGTDGEGQWRSGVLEQSWRIGGASGAEIAALHEFRADPTLRVVHASTREVYGEGHTIPKDAWVHYDGVDRHGQRLVKYVEVRCHGYV